MKKFFYITLRWFFSFSIIPRPLKYRIANLLANPRKQKRYLFVKRHKFGFNYSGSLDSFIDWRVYFFGAYNEHELNIIKDVSNALKEKNVFLDIGSSTGEFSISMAHIFPTVIGVEPLIHSYNQSLVHAKINNISNVRFFNIALGEKKSKTKIYLPLGENKGIAKIISQEKTTNHIEQEVLMLTADDLLADNNIEKIEIIKLDAQGYEMNVLLGMKKILMDFKPIILFDHVHKKKNFSKILDIFPQSYRIFGLAQRKKVFGFINISLSRYLLSTEDRSPLFDIYLAVPQDKLYIMDNEHERKRFQIS